jgi:deazaflavin-dependent oxidoreductase (nitroreductase family)
MERQRLVRGFQRRFFNPGVRWLLERGVRVPAVALLETTGRRTGRPRRVPVTDGLDGDTFWIVAEHGDAADYVRNIRQEPQVRVKVGGEWRQGMAEVLDDADPEEVLPRLNSRVSAAMVRLSGTDLTVIRVDLDDG